MSDENFETIVGNRVEVHTWVTLKWYISMRVIGQKRPIFVGVTVDSIAFL